ncbi:alpha/beta fold hydrolase [Amycolatopsis jejuensis]|uniref:alpha/beta fold hydrolase n=1 Tax=Amycolatopsis jejuensis TaxID=330084 RepID=UPI0005261292|nr:alpha/beta hydrolase [Amycolatopsis jejuensis]
MNRTSIPGPAGELSVLTTGDPAAKALPILFAHPINLQAACWAEVVGPLDRFCVLPDLRGHGRSEPLGPFGVEHWAADLLAALDHFAIPRAHVIGGSLGGALSVYLAATHPDRVASIVSVGGALAIEGDGLDAAVEAFRTLGPRRVFEDNLPEMSLAPGAPAEVVERMLDLSNPNDAETVSAIWAATTSSDVREHAPAVQCPATVITGAFDRTCTPEQAREMADALGVGLVTMPGVGHLPMLEAPQALAELLSAHLDRE